MTDPTECGTDASVGDVYRSVARERPPQALDRRVLQAAKQAVSRDRPRWSRWLGPAVAATTVGAGFVVAGGQYDLWPVSQPAGDTTNVVRELGDAARESGERIREFGDAVTPPVLNPDAVPAGAERDTEPSTLPFCGAEQTASRVAWEACIAALEDSGRDAAANEERRKLRAAFARSSP